MPINFSSENYSKNASDYYKSVQQSKYSELYKTKRISDITEEYERSVQNTSFALQYGTAAENMLDKEEVNALSNQYENILENSFTAFRFDPKEITERIGRDNQLSMSMVAEANEAGIENIRFQGSDDFVENIKYAMAFPLQAPNVLNNRLVGWLPDNLGGTFFDLSESWSEASYENAINAHKAMSMFGQVPESVARLASYNVADRETRGAVTMILDMVKEKDPSFADDMDAEVVLRQAQALAIEENVDWDRDGWMAWDMVTSGIDVITGESQVNPAADLIRYTDPIWVGGENKEGIRDLILKAIETSDTLDPKIQDWLSNNPDIIDLLKTSRNGAAFTSAINQKKQEYKMAGMFQANMGVKTYGAHAKVFAHGFALDPTLGLDIAATIGTGGLKIVGGVATGSLKLLGAGSTRIAAKVTSKTPLLTRLNSMSIKALERETKFLKAAKFLERGTDKITLLQKFMPTQILSELLVPLGKRLLTSGKDETTDLISYLKGSDYLPKSVTGKAMYRSMAGSIEGLVWGRIEYGYASAFEDSLNVAMYGQEQADTIAYMRNQSGMMTQSMIMGGIMGGVLGPAIGGTFDAAGATVTGTAKLLNKWSEVSPDNWLNKTTAFAEQNFQDRIAKTSWWGVAKSILNVATENNITADSRLSVNKALPKIDFGPSEESVANNINVLETELSKLASDSSEAGVVNFQKAVDNVVDNIPEGESISADLFTMKVQNALAEQIKDRRKRLGWRVNLLRGTVKQISDLDSDTKRNNLTNDGKEPKVIRETEGNEFSKEAKRLSEEKAARETTLAEKEEQLETLKEQVTDQKNKNKENPEEANTEAVTELEEKIQELEPEIETEKQDIEELGLRVGQAAANHSATNKESVLNNQAVFNKLLKKKLLADVSKEGEMHPIAAMMAFGMDETLVRKMKNGATLEQKAVLDKLLAFDPELAPLDGNEISALKDVIEENFLQEMGVRDEVMPHTLFDQLIKEGVSEEVAFNEAYNFSFEELAADDARKGLDVLTDDEGNSLLTEEQQSVIDKAN